jgi:hypothetical protein
LGGMVCDGWVMVGRRQDWRLRRLEGEDIVT